MTVTHPARAELPNVRHLEVLVEVARRRGVSAAARVLHLSQPAATQAIAGLERTFDARLFDRAPDGVAPTQAGAACALRAERALAQVREGLAEAARTRAEGVRLRGRDAREPGAPSLGALTPARLAALVAIVDAQGFGAAARDTGLARATLHRAARELEAALGTPLFEATSHGLRPTREAERLARRARLAAGEIAQARAELALLAGRGSGGTVIGAMPLARSALVPSVVLRFAARRPEHAISILDGPYESMLDALRHGAADVLVGALRDAAPDDVVQEHLFDDPLALVARAGHPLAALSRRTRTPPVRELAAAAWIAPHRGSPLRRHFDALLASVDARPPAAAVECNSLVAARALLLASDRLMLSSVRQVQHEIATGQLVALPHPAGRVVRRIGLTRRADWRPTVVQTELLDGLRSGVRGPDRTHGREDVNAAG